MPKATYISQFVRAWPVVKIHADRRIPIATIHTRFVFKAGKESEVSRALLTPVLNSYLFAVQSSTIGKLISLSLRRTNPHSASSAVRLPIADNDGAPSPMRFDSRLVVGAMALR